MPLRNVESVVKRLHISISNIFSVFAYNALTTKTIMKKFFLGKQMLFHFLTKNFVYQFPILTYSTESGLFLSMPMFHLSPYL